MNKENIDEKKIVGLKQKLHLQHYLLSILFSCMSAIVASFFARYLNYYESFIEKIRLYSNIDYSLCSLEYIIFILFFSILLLFARRTTNIRLNDNYILLFIVLYPLWLNIIYFITKPNFLMYSNLEKVLSNFLFSCLIRIFITGCIVAIYIIVLNCASKVIAIYKNRR